MFEFDEQSEYFVRVRGRTQGPFDEAKIRAMIERGRIGRHDQISVDGTHWERAGDWTELFSSRGDRKVRQTHEMAATRTGARRRHDDSPHFNDTDSASSEESLWYYNDHEKQYGPISLADLKERITRGEIDPDAYGWTDGMENWEPLHALSVLSSSFLSQPAAPAVATAGAVASSAEAVPAGGAAVAGPRPDSSFWLIITTILITIVLVASVAAGVVLFMQRQGNVEEPETEDAAAAGRQSDTADDSKTPDAKSPDGGNAGPAPKVDPQPKTAPKAAPANPPPAKTPAKTGVSGAQVYERSIKSVFTIVTDRNQGSGFALASERLIVTNAHVIQGANTILVYDKDGLFSKTTVQYRDDKRDIALLAVPQGFSSVPGLAVARAQPRVGESVYAIGTPKGQAFTFTRGVVSQIREGVKSGRNTLLAGVKIIQTDASISPGSSGGPLLNESGEVIGVTTLGSNAAVGANNLNFAVSATEIAKARTSSTSRSSP